MQLSNCDFLLKTENANADFGDVIPLYVIVQKQISQD